LLIKSQHMFTSVDKYKLLSYNFTELVVQKYRVEILIGIIIVVIVWTF
jgi:hypothetical protein